MYVIDAIYNKKRREELQEKYKYERYESRRRGCMWVVAYEVFSIALFVLSAVVFAKSVGN